MHALGACDECPGTPQALAEAFDGLSGAGLSKAERYYANQLNHCQIRPALMEYGASAPSQGSGCASWQDPTQPQLSKHAADRLAALKAELAKEQEFQSPTATEAAGQNITVVKETYSTVQTSSQAPIVVTTQRSIASSRSTPDRVPVTATKVGRRPQNTESMPLKAQDNYSASKDGQWTDGLCGCCSDCPMCFVVICLAPIPLGQLYERAVHQRMFGRTWPLSCCSIACFMFFAYIFSAVLDSTPAILNS